MTNNPLSANTRDDFDRAAAAWDESSYRTERAQAIARAIQNAVPLTPNMTALEYGCGTGLLSFALQPHLGPITLADSSPGMLAVLAGKIAASAVPNMTPLLLDLLAGPPPAARAQLIYTLMTLHHIPDTAAILRAFYHLLEAPGWLCVADLDREDGSFHGPGFDGHNGFDRAALAALAEETGFTNVRFETAYHTPHPANGIIRHFPIFLMTAEKRG